MKVQGPAGLGIEDCALGTESGGKRIPVGVTGLAARVPGEDRVQEDEEGRGCHRRRRNSLYKTEALARPG